MTLKQEMKAHLQLALPMALAQLAQVALNVVDTVMCGRLGGTALAGAGLGFTVYATLWIPTIGAMVAVAPMVSQSYGAGDHPAIGRTVRMAMWLAVALSILPMIAMYHAKPVLLWMGQNPEVSEIAEQYVRAVMWSCIPGLCVVALRSFLDSLNRPRVGLIVTASSILVNILANWLFMYGKYGLPQMGVAGTGWGTTFANLWMVAMMLLYVMWDKELRVYHDWKGLFRFDLVYIKELLRLGLPLVGSLTAEVWLFTATAFLMGILGKNSMAAHQIAINLSSTTFMFAVGIANASTVRVGQAIGRGDVPAAKRAGYIGMILGMISMGTMALVFILFPHFIIGFYLNTKAAINFEVVKLATILLSLAAMFQLFDALQVTSQGALRGLKDTKSPMLIGLFAYWGIGLTSGVGLAFGLHWREVGLWTGLIIGLVVAGIILSLRFRHHFKNPEALLQYQSLESEVLQD